jgi:sigma-B regulation protein RsbU (phosphoserine phosphatase)
MVVDLGSPEASRNNADPLEVKLAGEVQTLLLPKSSPLCSWCCMAARSRMANVLGGDFYDFIELEDGCQILFVGDVTGHSLHASVVMALVYGFIHRAAQENCSPHEVVTDLNTFLRTFAQRSERLDHFFSATLFFGVIDPRSKTMSYINAGHPAGLVKRKGDLLRLPATSHPVGYFEQAEFQVDSFQFADHDRLLLYTDGVVDSSNPQGGRFGIERLDEALRRLDGDHMVFLDSLFAEVRSYLNGQPLFDDCTAIVIDFHDALLQGGR